MSELLKYSAESPGSAAARDRSSREKAQEAQLQELLFDESCICGGKQVCFVSGGEGATTLGLGHKGAQQGLFGVKPEAQGAGIAVCGSSVCVPALLWRCIQQCLVL